MAKHTFFFLLCVIQVSKAQQLNEQDLNINSEFSSALQSVLIHKTIEDSRTDREKYLDALTYAIEDANIGNQVAEITSISNEATINVLMDLSGASLSNTIGQAKDLALQKIDEAAKEKVMSVLKSRIQDLPPSGPIDKYQIEAVLKKSLEAEGFSQADLIQNEAIRLLAAQVDEISRQDIASADDLDMQTSELLKISKDLQALKKDVAEQAKATSKQKKVKSSIKSNLRKASEFTGRAQEQLSAAAGIASKLGNNELASQLDRGSRIADAAKNIMLLAATKNPMAILPTINSVMGVFGGGGGSGPDLSWIADYLEAISNQIKELSVQIEQNHIQVMGELDHLKFLNVQQLRGISYLLRQDVMQCENLVPSAWQKDGELDFSVNRVFQSYEELKEKSWRNGTNSWSGCKDGINLLFSKSLEIHPSFTLPFIYDEIEKKHESNTGGISTKDIQSSIKVFAKILSQYPNEDVRKRLLVTPSVWVSNYNSEEHNNRAKQLIELTEFDGQQLFLNPYSESDLIDPAILGKYVGYLLTVYPYFEITDNNRLITYTKLINGDHERSKEGLRALKKALALVNLSMSQQMILSGEGLGYQHPNLNEVIKSLGDIKYVNENIGLSFAATKMDKFSAMYYQAAHKANNEAALNGLHGDWGFPGSIIRVNSGNVTLNIKNVKHGLILPDPSLFNNSDTFDDVAFPYSPHVNHLYLLQERLVQAIVGFDVEDKAGKLVALNYLAESK